jgi:hypothetical protein
LNFPDFLRLGRIETRDKNLFRKFFTQLFGEGWSSIRENHWL